MARRLFLLCGPTDYRVVLEALKPEHKFDRVIGLSRIDAHTMHVDYFGTSDGRYLESKEDEHRGEASSWFAACLELNDVVHAKVHRDFIPELMASGQLAKIDVLFTDVVSDELTQYASSHDITVSRQLDVARWLHDRERTLPVSAPNFKFLYAEYGTETQSANVTETLAAKFAEAHGQVQVSNSLCGCDPHFGTGKMLSVDFEVDGVARNIRAWEGTFIVIS